MILGVAMLTPRAVTGGLIHIANHAFAKITLFFCAGAIYVSSRKKDITEMKGLGRAMPLTFAAFSAASLSMIGAPPAGGFVSKWFLLTGAVAAHQVGIVAVLLVSTLLNAAYFVPVVYYAFFTGSPPEKDMEELSEASPFMVAPLLVTAAMSVVAGLYPDLFIRIIKGVLP
jgi:multicomponent Na+:H+ antiporter subunit D